MDQYLTQINLRVGGPLDQRDPFDRANCIVSMSWTVLNPDKGINVPQEDYMRAEVYLYQVLEDLDMYHGVQC